MRKDSYFQGGGGINEPTPGKKKYKSDPALVMQPRFREPLYHNYDVYSDGKMGPGEGYNSLQDFKSVKDFLEARRKKFKPKYVSDDSWQLDDGKIVKQVKARIKLLQRIVKKSINETFNSISQFRKQQDNNDIDFPLDQYMDPAVEVGINEQADHNTNWLGGMMDEYLPENDFEGKDPSTLDFGRDYSEDVGLNISKERLVDLIKKYLQPSTHGLFGLPDGVDMQDEDLGYPTTINPYYGTVDNGNTMYEDK